MGWCPNFRERLKMRRSQPTEFLLDRFCIVGYDAYPDLCFLKERRPMTIIVGVLCENGLAIASDSQAQSFRGVETKRMDYLKIEEVCNEKDACLVVVGAGMVAFIGKSTAKLCERLRKEKLSTMAEVAEEAEDVMTELQRRYDVEKAEKLGLAKGKSSLGRHLQDRVPFFAIMIGGKFPGDERPAIYTVGMDGVAERADKFESLGSGSAYAEYLLAKFYRESQEIQQAATLAAYAVEEVKKIDPGCGGATQIVTIQGNKLRRWKPTEVSALVSQIDERDKAFVDAWWSHGAMPVDKTA
jgi:20S proteasome alpha/beta subunit